MRFATITDTIDWFEAVLVLGCVVAILVAGTCVRSGWREFRWGQRDNRLYMRDLGVVQIVVAVFLMSIALVVTQNALFQLSVPSAINEQESIIDTMVATDTRLTYLWIVFSVIVICMALTWWRNESMRQRREMVRAHAPAVAAAATEAARAAEVADVSTPLEPLGNKTTGANNAPAAGNVQDAVPVVEAPVVVVDKEPGKD